MSIRAVFFDLGGVIVRTEYQAPRQRLAERFGMEYEDIVRLVFGGSPNGTAAKATVGEIGADEHWQAVARKLKIQDEEIESVRTEFFAGDVIDWNIVRFLRSLRGRYKTGLISNAWSDLRAYILKQKFDDAFDKMIISAEAGAAKPDPGIYHIALEQLEVSPNEAVFVDDFIENIEACEKIGIQGIHFRDAESAIQQVKATLGWIPNHGKT
jgi:epoxide hydrolase-like predicted phosphatase